MKKNTVIILLGIIVFLFSVFFLYQFLNPSQNQSNENALVIIPTEQNFQSTEAHGYTDMEDDTSVNNTASIQGVVHVLSDNTVINKGLLYLKIVNNKDTKVPSLILGDPRLDDGDIIGVTNEEGFFIIDNILPGEYYIVVQYPPYWTLVQKSAQVSDPLIISLQPNADIKLGDLYIP